MNKKYIYTPEEIKQVKEILKGLSQQAEYIGEDGNMTCVSSTKRGALIKFKRLMREDVGPIEAEDLEEKDISVGYLYLVDPDSKKDEEFDGDWYVSYKQKSDYKVWVMRF